MMKSLFCLLILCLSTVVFPNLKKGAILYKQNNFRAAERQFANFLRQKGIHSQDRNFALKYLAICQHMQGKQDEAKKTFKYALRLNPSLSISPKEVLDPSIIAMLEKLKAENQATSKPNSNKTGITILSNAPNANVSINGIIAGSTSPKGQFFQLTPGTATIEVTAPGFQGKRFKVNAKRSQQLQAKVELVNIRQLEQRRRAAELAKKQEIEQRNRERAAQLAQQAQQQRPQPSPNQPQGYNHSPQGATSGGQQPYQPPYQPPGYQAQGGSPQQMYQQPQQQKSPYIAPIVVPIYQQQQQPMYGPQPYGNPYGMQQQQQQPLVDPLAPTPQDDSSSSGDGLVDPLKSLDTSKLRGDDIPPDELLGGSKRRSKRSKSIRPYKTKRSSRSSDQGAMDGARIGIALLPGAIGQFYDGKYALGTLFFAAQAAGLGVYFYSNQEIAKQQQLFDEFKEKEETTLEEIESFKQDSIEVTDQLNSQKMYGLIALGIGWGISSLETMMNPPARSSRKSSRLRVSQLKIRPDFQPMGTPMPNWSGAPEQATSQYFSLVPDGDSAKIYGTSPYYGLQLEWKF